MVELFVARLMPNFFVFENMEAADIRILNSVGFDHVLVLNAKFARALDFSGKMQLAVCCLPAETQTTKQKCMVGFGSADSSAAIS
jgi:hypothetical protein